MLEQMALENDLIDKISGLFAVRQHLAEIKVLFIKRYFLIQFHRSYQLKTCVGVAGLEPATTEIYGFKNFVRVPGLEPGTTEI